MGIAIHCDAGFAVPRYGGSNVCIVGRFVNIRYDCVPKGIACDTLYVHLATDSMHHLAVLRVRQRFPASKHKITPFPGSPLSFLDVRQGNLRNRKNALAQLGLRIPHNGRFRLG